MAKLSASEQAALKRLQEKSEAPDAAPVSKSISATVDLSDPKSIAAAIKHGFLTEDEVEELKEEEGDNGKEKKGGTSTPRRKGYFKDGGDDE